VGDIKSETGAVIEIKPGLEVVEVHPDGMVQVSVTL